MANKRTSYRIGNGNSKQKNISITLEKKMKEFQKYLQTKENIKYGRKAKSISFLYATSKVRDFAEYIVRNNK